MPHTVNRLTAAKIQRATAGAMLYDGNGLYFSATGPGAGSWLMRYYRYNTPHWMGLGSFRDVSLAEARQEVIVQRQVLRSGRDPIRERKDQRLGFQKKERMRKSFREVFEEWIAARINAGAWKNAEETVYHKRKQAERHIFPTIGGILVDQIDTNVVLEILKPLWEAKKLVTANKVRRIIKDALDYAKIREYRSGDNPAAGKDHIAKIAPPKPDSQHYPSINYHELPAFMLKLHRMRALSAEALRLMIIVTGRPREVTGAPWSELGDFERTKIWRVPKERMKAERDHIIPLSEPAIALLVKLKRAREGDFVFRGKRAGNHMDQNSLNQLTGRMGLTGLVTPHGFRATFESWGMANTEKLSEGQKEYRMYLLELCLAHQINAAEKIGANPAVLAAYQRDELVDQRRPIMDAWARFVMSLINRPKVDDELAEAAE